MQYALCYKDRYALCYNILLLLWGISITCIYGSHMYAKVVVFSKVPLPNYRYDLDDRRPQREVCYTVLLSVSLLSPLL